MANFCELAARAFDMIESDGLAATIDNYEEGVMSFWYDDDMIDNPRYEAVCFIFNYLQSMQ